MMVLAVLSGIHALTLPVLRAISKPVTTEIHAQMMPVMMMLEVVSSPPILPLAMTETNAPQPTVAWTGLAWGLT